MSNLSLLEPFAQYLEDHAETADNLTIESKMVLFSRGENITTEESILLGEEVTFVLAGMLNDWLQANEDATLADVLEAFCLENHLSADLASKLINDILEAATDDDSDDDDDDDDEKNDTDELEAKVRLFLARLYSNVPDSFAAYFDLKGKFSCREPYGNDWAGSTPDGRYDPRNARMGHTPKSQEADRHDQWKSVYQGHPIVSVCEGEELDEHWFHHSTVGDYDIHQGAGIHGGCWAAREKGRGSHRDLKTFSGKNAKQAAIEHAEISTAAKYQALGEDADMLLSPTSDAPVGGWLDKSLATAGHYADSIPSDTSSKNISGLKGEGGKAFRHGVMVPHHAVPETEAEASRNGFAIRIAKVHGNHTHITTEKPEQADHLANRVGELYGRLAVHRYTAEETPAEKSLYRRSPMADGLKKKATIANKRNIAEAVRLMEGAKPNTYEITNAAVADRIAAEQQADKRKHPDDGAERTFTLR